MTQCLKDAKSAKLLKMDGWMDDLLSTVFQSYQEDGWVIIEGCVQWNPIYNLHSQAGLESGTTRLVDQHLACSCEAKIKISTV